MTIATSAAPGITIWSSFEIPIDRQWEAAYRRFETPRQEISKFKRRLTYLGYRDWSADARIVELFCGRGNGLHALTELGFNNIAGVDLSQELLENYVGPAPLFVGDCRELAFDDHEFDIAIVQGGLHHLPQVPDDLDRCLREIRRVLKPNGMFCMVEPWATPFLHVVHTACKSSVARRCWAKLDALAEMTERELTTYECWLSQSAEILQVVRRYFDIDLQKIAFGKIMLRATPVAVLHHADR